MTPELITKLKKYVNQGAKLLDSKTPNWDQNIDLARLNLNSCMSCVLGQIYGDWQDACDYLDIDGIDDVFGFSAVYTPSGEYANDMYSTLTDLWRAEILARTTKEQDKAPEVYQEQERERLSLITHKE